MIAQEAGVATGTLFHYFKTKEELIESLYLDIKNEAGNVLRDAAKSKGDQREKLANIYTKYAEWGLKNAKKIHFMQQFCYSPFISKATHQEGISNFQFLIDEIALGIKEGVIRDYSPEIVLSIISSSQMGAILDAAREKDPKKQRDILKQSLDLIFHGVLQD